VPLAIPDETGFVDKLLQWSVFNAENKLQSEAGEHAVASIINKRIEGDFTSWIEKCAVLIAHGILGFQNFLSEKLESKWLSQATDTNLALPIRRRVISAWTWVWLIPSLVFSGVAENSAVLDGEGTTDTGS
jgi:DNA repair/transcription protein MET18/MMS19